MDVSGSHKFTVMVIVYYSMWMTVEHNASSDNRKSVTNWLRMLLYRDATPDYMISDGCVHKPWMYLSFTAVRGVARHIKNGRSCKCTYVHRWTSESKLPDTHTTTRTTRRLNINTERPATELKCNRSQRLKGGERHEWDRTRRWMSQRIKNQILTESKSNQI